MRTASVCRTISSNQALEDVKKTLPKRHDCVHRESEWTAASPATNQVSRPVCPVLTDKPEIVGQWEKKLDAGRYSRIPVGSGIDATEVAFSVGFEGDPGLFNCAPSAFSSVLPHGETSEREVRFSLVSLDPNGDDQSLRGEAERNIANIRQYLEWVRQDLARFMEDFEQSTRTKILNRRQRIANNRALVHRIGFPIRKTGEASAQLFVPEVRKKLAPKLPEPKNDIAEPFLELEVYEDILDTIQSMAVVMERSPAAFRHLHEEDLRWLFLLPLNGLYQGQATGETFNFEGKTDILIRIHDKNIFIAECAIWDGPAYFKSKIDQLLGYATWRDSKLAIIIFNRTRKFSGVLAKVAEGCKSHPNFKRELQRPGSTWFRCLISHRDDPDRELTLTVLAFEVPA